jgi:hypothetical protein
MLLQFELFIPQNPFEHAPEILSNLGEGKAETGIRWNFGRE